MTVVGRIFFVKFNKFFLFVIDFLSKRKCAFIYINIFYVTSKPSVFSFYFVTICSVSIGMVNPMFKLLFIFTSSCQFFVI